MAFLPSGRWMSCHVLFLAYDSISSFIAIFHCALFSQWVALLYNMGVLSTNLFADSAIEKDVS